MQAIETPNSSVIAAVFAAGDHIAFVLGSNDSMAFVYRPGKRAVNNCIDAIAKGESAGQHYNVIKHAWGPGTAHPVYKVWNTFVTLYKPTPDTQLSANVQARIAAAQNGVNSVINDVSDEYAQAVLRLSVGILDHVLEDGNK